MSILNDKIAVQEKEPESFFIVNNDNIRVNTTKMLDTEYLIKEAFKENIDKGIELLFVNYYSILCNHAIRYVTSKEIAEDIVSDVFFEFHTKALYTTINTSFRAYLFMCVRNRAYDYIRAEIRHKNTSLDEAIYVVAEKDNHPDSVIQYEELYQDVEKAINEMPLKRREIYLLNRFEGKKSQEIADDLDVSIRTVEGHLYQAVRQIKETLQGKWSLIVACFVNLFL
ncbi:RNA polymerase sigma-70 factor [Arcicella lustrica]|uniref:RNA polymerase sigma-70 factor n=1 Tax=Arcicella lustrica TaxID=2984196 RepID=A0ABU5SQU4_9BACT|nr:RNA polymerase sigma-70 factor [Arcicella sp. DC25W]MEA5429279.1 RNA polymerase sigma-70 factor [Arcicella sp. DC25W]